MHHTQRRYNVFVLKIREIRLQLQRCQLAFVGNSPAGERREIESIDARNRFIDNAGAVVTQNIEFALKIVGIGNVDRAFDKNLLHLRFARTGTAAQIAVIDRHDAVAHQFQTQPLHLPV